MVVAPFNLLANYTVVVENIFGMFSRVKRVFGFNGGRARVISTIF
jgi:hypothetical protein